MINGGWVPGRRLSLICLKDIMGGALTVVAPPLGTFGRIIGPFAWTSCVGGVVFTAGPFVSAGQSHITHKRGFCETQLHRPIKAPPTFD